MKNKRRRKTEKQLERNVLEYEEESQKENPPPDLGVSVNDELNIKEKIG